MIDKFSISGCTVPLKNKNAIIRITNSFEYILLSSKTKPKLIGTDRGKEFYYRIFQKLSNNNSNKHYSRNSSIAGVFAERFIRTIRNFIKRRVFLKGDETWVDILPEITKQYNNTKHSSIKLTALQRSLKRNERYVYQILLDKRKKIKLKFEVNYLVRTSDLKKTIS